ncbi:MAG: hypothetical protein AAF713_09690 [Pseudomonadota bacterium]
MIDKRLIFCATPGRSGTAFLTRLLGRVPGIAAAHEPKPNFVAVAQAVQQDPALAERFWREEKLPAIAGGDASVYAETSHLACKGFLEPLMRLGIPFDLIVLRRQPRAVAWSLVERNCVPARTGPGIRYLLDPRDRTVMPLPGWEGLTDYQLAFWYALEIERRQRRYAAMVAQSGGAVATITNRQLGAWSHFVAMLQVLRLMPAEPRVLRRSHGTLSATHHNANRRVEAQPADLGVQEAEIWRRVGLYEPLLQADVEAFYRAAEASLCAENDDQQAQA